jgi:hypothetical protein
MQLSIICTIRHHCKAWCGPASAFHGGAGPEHQHLRRSAGGADAQAPHIPSARQLPPGAILQRIKLLHALRRQGSSVKTPLQALQAHATVPS